MSKRYPQPRDGEIVVPIMDGYKMACCDCGMVHRLEFGIVATKETTAGRFTLHKPRTKQPLRVTMQAYHDQRATAAMRRTKDRP